jgi:hypothetical protein
MPTGMGISFVLIDGFVTSSYTVSVDPTGCRHTFLLRFGMDTVYVSCMPFWKDRIWCEMMWVSQMLDK